MMTGSSGGFREDPSGRRVVGIDSVSGKTLWEYANWQCRIPVAHAVDAGEDRMLIVLIRRDKDKESLREVI